MRKTESWGSAKARLLCQLDRVKGYCQPVQNEKAQDQNAEEPLWEQHVRWPGREFLHDIESNVLVLAKHERARQIVPAWKAFKIVDKRVPAFRLVQRVDNLAKRAVERLKDAGESELAKMARDPDDVATQCFLHDLVLQKKNLSKLVSEYRRCIRPRIEAWPLVEWLIEIRHPMVRDFDDRTSLMSDLFQGALEKLKLSRRRKKQRERVRRHRLRKKSAGKSLQRLTSPRGKAP